jgi:hypothetical protein
MDMILLGILITIGILFCCVTSIHIWVHWDIIIYYLTCKCFIRNYQEIPNVV